MNLGLIALIVGLVLFVGVHAVRVFAEPWRQRQIARWGESGWKGAYSVVSLLGFLILLWGFAQARQGAAPLFWWPDGVAKGLRHAVALLMLPAFWLTVAAYVPRNHLKAAVKHPMTLSVKLWAAAHLLVNHSLPDLLLFGSFLAWAILCFRAARRRSVQVDPGTAVGTSVTLLLGTAAYLLFAFVIHAAWLGVHPLRMG